jgi:hypothetical protein
MGWPNHLTWAFLSYSQEISFVDRYFFYKALSVLSVVEDRVGKNHLGPACQELRVYQMATDQ